MAMKGIDTMTVIKSICSGVGALSAVLLCASVLWSEMGDLDDEKLDNKQFDQYVKAENESDKLYREANAKVQDRIFEALETVQTDVKLILKNSGE
jgi:hypothetical protein